MEVRLGEEQEAMEKEKTKPHFLLRPGSPTADEQVQSLRAHLRVHYSP